MSIHGVTFDNQSPTAKDHGALFAGILYDGILKGCNITYFGTTISISPGYIIIAGRLFQVSSSESVGTSGSSSYARLKAKVDLSGTSTEETFSQVSFLVDYASTESGFSDLTQQDINGSGTTYEIELAIFRRTSTAIQEKVSQAHPAKPFLYGASLPSTVPAAGTIFFKKA